jgi:hypothetical protein
VLAIALLAAAVVIIRQRKQLAHGKASAAPSSSAAASGYPVFTPFIIDIEGKAGGAPAGVSGLPGDTYEARDKAPWVLKI